MKEGVKKNNQKCRNSYKPQSFGGEERGGGTLATTEKQTLIKDGSENDRRLPLLVPLLFKQPPDLHIPEGAEGVNEGEDVGSNRKCFMIDDELGDQMRVV